MLWTIFLIIATIVWVFTLIAGATEKEDEHLRRLYLKIFGGASLVMAIGVGAEMIYGAGHMMREHTLYVHAYEEEIHGVLLLVFSLVCLALAFAGSVYFFQVKHDQARNEESLGQAASVIRLSYKLIREYHSRFGVPDNCKELFDTLNKMASNSL